MGRLTTHILDTELGRPAAGVTIEAFAVSGDGVEKLTETRTNADGRTDAPLLEGESFDAGVYELRFHCGPYLRDSGRKLPAPSFLDVVTIRFGVADPSEHFHVPLLLQTHGYATYRGS
ncbi:hydroxyisourate hydrolase [Chelatococcus sambhunathii]|uniref:5-hydroxyisourate hydrolase n=1 Tax=Chelatococcus sambhunathii TaxID=363953 RepID=A0ABU1DD49_9HYPH|nr:hydroxyisourate hydrolase [Chelatococcus sambhunathii]MDR4306042.1 hydroxyisourate hydrolase [Chelatococcus sambhunathii]